MIAVSMMLVACQRPAAESPLLAVSAEAAGAPCSTGCSGPTPDEVAHLTDGEIAELLTEVASAPVGAAELAVETLLFHGAQTRDHLARRGSGPLSEAHRSWLTHELARDEVAIGLRLVARDGALLGHREDVVPLGAKQHLLLRDMGAFGRADVNGKVKRVGVKHLWARF